MSSEDLKELKTLIERIKNNLDKLNNLKNNSDCYQAEQILSDIKNYITKANNIIDEMNQNESLTGRLLSSARAEEKDLRIYENHYREKVEMWKSVRAKQDLMEGKLTGADALKAAREIGLDNIKETDNQGLMIESIAENVKGANQNLTNINAGLNEQGEQMNRIQKTTLETESQVKQTGKIMTRMEGRAKCIQIITFLAVVLFGLFDIFWIVFLCIKKFYWDKKKK
jgi:DNA repair exonuclease SbcCD ATPase subunit